MLAIKKMRAKIKSAKNKRDIPLSIPVREHYKALKVKF
jgi:hypothetical protein